METKRSAKVLTHIGLILMAGFIALPFIWMILTSIKTLAEAEAIPSKIFPESSKNFLLHSIISIQ